ncbi:hypothetical protein J4463_02570 [Candidatus Pacearchaeota archaeon]|nr:hypothetical protein [Candidatus Pacearchaeota archaeon]
MAKTNKQIRKLGKRSRRCRSCKAKEGELHKATCRIWTKRGKPHFYYTFFCNRCGKERPKIFMVPEEEWLKVTKYYYNKTDILCRRCFNYIKRKKEEYKNKTPKKSP